MIGPSEEYKAKVRERDAQHRAAFVAGLRRLAELLESHPALPMPYPGHWVAFPRPEFGESNVSKTAKVEYLFDLAEAADMPVTREARDRGEVYEAHFEIFPGYEYRLHASLDASAAEEPKSEPVTRDMWDLSRACRAAADGTP